MYVCVCASSRRSWGASAPVRGKAETLCAAPCRPAASGSTAWEKTLCSTASAPSPASWRERWRYVDWSQIRAPAAAAPRQRSDRVLLFEAGYESRPPKTWSFHCHSFHCDCFHSNASLFLPPGPREGCDRHRPPPPPEPDQHLQRGRPAEALEALRAFKRRLDVLALHAAPPAQFFGEGGASLLGDCELLFMLTVSSARLSRGEPSYFSFFCSTMRVCGSRAVFTESFSRLSSHGWIWKRFESSRLVVSTLEKLFKWSRLTNNNLKLFTTL